MIITRFEAARPTICAGSSECGSERPISKASESGVTGRVCSKFDRSARVDRLASMAEARPSSPSERSPRETKKGPAPRDPEAVAAATLAFVIARAGELARVSRAAAVQVRVGARWAWPHLRRAALGTARALGSASASVSRWCWTRRVGLARVGQRVLWWSALALLVLAGRALLGEGGAPGDELWLRSTLLWFVLGSAMASVVLITAPELRMRRAAFALAGSHGALALLVWFAGV